MTTLEFVKAVFGVFAGETDCSIDITLPNICFGDGLNEYELECGLDPDTFYALDTYATCPRAYMIKYLAKKPLSIRFYAEVQETVRETIAEFARGRLKREEMVADFEKRFDELVKGPYPINQSDKKWAEDWKKSICAYFENFSPEWEQEGWQTVDAYIPVCGEVDGVKIKGVIDLLLKNAENEYAVVAHDHGSAYKRRKDGTLPKYGEGNDSVLRLKRKMYLYGSLLPDVLPGTNGQMSKIFLNVYKPEKQAAYVLSYDWSEEERRVACSWAKRMVKSISQASINRTWPAIIAKRIKNNGEEVEDRNFCLQRCVHGIRCRWAGWHPEEVSKFVDSPGIVQIPHEYVGVDIVIKPEYRSDQELCDIKRIVIISGGREKKETFVSEILKKMKVETIGDLASKTIYDFASIPGCGSAKIEALIKLYFDVVTSGVEGESYMSGSNEK